MSKKANRLYKYIHPKHYQIDIEISKDKKSFSGSEVIEFEKVGQPTERITLHAKNLIITEPKLYKIDKKSGNKEEISIARVNIQESAEELRLHVDDKIFPGNYIVELNFSANISNNLDGIYPSNFEVDGDKQQMIVTQFESHAARQAFPCVDEPEAKATFQLTLRHASNEVALSNTDVETESTEGELTTTKFQITPIMSTYLVAFCVGNIKYLESTSSSGVRIRTWATPQHVESTRFALETAVKAMDFYEEYYDIEFPISKCDFIALPDFASGAMENWGMITFREQALLVDKHTSLGTKQWVAIVVAHELTHQWFGNLVTMKWWTDLWLNEGFASWMEYLAVDKLFPHWDIWSQFAVDVQQSAMRLDALENTHPIEVPINHPDEIRSIFDTITYNKGASVINMLYNFLGSDNFRDGLRKYLKTFSYKNADTKDLWTVLEEVSGKPVKEFMSSWTEQPGMPLVEINEQHNHIEIKQSRFVSNPLSEVRSSDSTIWPIPLLLEGNPPAELGALITKSRQNINLPTGYKLPDKINSGQTGFYRTRYRENLQTKIFESLGSGTFGENDRMGLLADAYEIAKAGFTPVTEYFELLKLYRDEKELAAWEIITSSLGSIKFILSKNDQDDELRDLINPYIAKLVSDQYHELDWEHKESDTHSAKLLRPLILGAACGSDYEPAITEAMRQYDAWTGGEAIDPDFRSIVLITAARKGDRNAFELMLEAYKNSTSSDEKLSLTGAMTSFKDPDINRQVMDIIKDQEIVRLQDVGYWIAYMLTNRFYKLEAWEWVKNNWGWIASSIGDDLSFYRMPVYVARGFTSRSELENYKEFFADKQTPALKRSYLQGIEIIEINFSWRERDSQNAIDWLANNSEPTE